MSLNREAKEPELVWWFETISPRARRALWMILRLVIVYATLTLFSRLMGGVVRGQAATPGGSGLAKPGLAVAWEALLILLLALMFKRDMRVLGRYLGRPVKAGRAVLSVILYFILAITAVTTLAVVFFFFLPRELTRPTPPIAKSIVERLVRPIVETGEVGLGPALTGVALCITGPIAEELLFRGVLFLLLLRLLGRWPALVVSSIVFSGLHQLGMERINWAMALGHTISGLVLCLVVLRTHRLRWSILLHSAWNTSLLVALIIVMGSLWPTGLPRFHQAITGSDVQPITCVTPQAWQGPASHRSLDR